MSAGALHAGIENGKITDTGAVHVLVTKLLDAERAASKSPSGQDVLKQTESKFAPLVFGDPKDMARFCVDEAASRMAFERPESVHADPGAAANWYEMAARFARDAQEARGSGQGPAGPGS
jgi:hypothetical protein